MYKEKIVCFIDIMGFGEMIDHQYAAKPEDIYSILTEVKTSILDWLSTPITSNIDLQITQFSDCIVFSFLPVNHYFMTFSFFKELSIKMIMKHKVIFRGGITYGKIFHDSQFVFGPAMNGAYRLESKEAKSPRIVIDQSALQLRNDDCKSISDYTGQFLFQLTDTGYSYIDYIVDIIGYENQRDYYDNLRVIINNGLSSDNPSVLVKYEWMKVEYNKAQRNYPDLILL